MNGLARARGVQWCGHVLRRDNNDLVKRASDFEVAGRKGPGLRI